MISAAGGVLLLAVTGFFYFSNSGSPPAPQPAAKLLVRPGSVKIGGPFTLIDETGKTVTEKDFGKKYLLVYFGYTHSPDICPVAMSNMAKTLKLLGDDAQAIQSLFITIDPERDRPEFLRDYVEDFDPRIVGLTGTAAQVAAVAREYHVTYKKVSAADYNGSAPHGNAAPVPPGAGYLMVHSTDIYLMTPASQYLTRLPYDTPPKEVTRIIRLALEKYGNPAEEGG